MCVCQGVADEGQKMASSGTVRNDLSEFASSSLSPSHQKMQILIQRRAGQTVFSPSGGLICSLANRNKHTLH